MNWLIIANAVVTGTLFCAMLWLLVCCKAFEDDYEQLEKRVTALQLDLRDTQRRVAEVDVYTQVYVRGGPTPTFRWSVTQNGVVTCRDIGPMRVHKVVEMLIEHLGLHYKDGAPATEPSLEKDKVIRKP